MRRMIRRPTIAAGGVLLLVGVTVTAAGGSTPTWTLTKPAGAGSAASFSAVSCGSSTTCMAVGGGGSHHTESPVAEQWSGGKWTKTPSLQGGPVLMTAVSCPSSTWCVATGLGSGADPQFELWNGTSWTSMSAPELPGNPLALITGIACSSSSFCLAVGSQSSGEPNGSIAAGLDGTFDGGFARGTKGDSSQGEGTLPLAESWNGANWSVVTVPASLDKIQLSNASCPVANWCQVVGTDRTTSVVATFSGGLWTPGSRQRKHAYLADVSCVSQDACVAVGSHATKSATSTLTESWNGTAWEAVASPNAGPTDGLGSVSCTSTTSCIAVGGSSTGSGNTLTGVATLIESWNGSAWTVEPGPSPVPFATLSGVSCVSPSMCVAVGASSPNAGHSYLLAEALG